MLGWNLSVAARVGQKAGNVAWPHRSSPVCNRDQPRHARTYYTRRRSPCLRHGQGQPVVVLSLRAGDEVGRAREGDDGLGAAGSQGKKDDTLLTNSYPHRAGHPASHGGEHSEGETEKQEDHFSRTIYLVHPGYVPGRLADLRCGRPADAHGRMPGCVNWQYPVIIPATHRSQGDLEAEKNQVVGAPGGHYGGRQSAEWLAD